MNIPLSLILYNPIEALFLFYVCNLFSGHTIPFKDLIKKNWLNILFFSTLLLALQWIPNAYTDFHAWKLITGIFISRILSPILLYILYNKKNKISLLRCFVIFTLYSTSINLIVIFFNFGITPNNNLIVEFFGNIFMKVIQVLLINIFYEVFKFMKDLFLKIFDSNSNKSPAFTDLDWYSKEMTDEMKKEIESK